MKTNITVKYPAGHSYTTEWESLEEMFCPSCGKHEVWHATDEGDYYVGEEHICRACGVRFYLPMGVHTAKNDDDTQRLAQLKEARA